MSEKSKVITIADLLKRKDELKKNKNKTANLYIASLDSEIVIKAPDRQLAFDLIAKAQAGDNTADNHAVLQCVIEPNLKDSSLQEGLGALSPLDVVDALFLPGEIAAISSQILDLAGFGGGVKRIEDETKN